MSKLFPTFFANSICRKSLRFILLGLLIGLSGFIPVPDYKVTAQQTPIQSCPTCKLPSAQTIYTPLIDLPEATYAEINLNCRSAHPIDVVPTFYRASGAPIVGETIHLLPSEMRFVDVQSLIPQAEHGRHDWGGMSLSYTGNTMEVWAQMTLHGIDKKESVNSLFAVVDAPRSNRREAVWRMPKNATATLALGNYSDTPAAATLAFSNGDVEQVNLAPYATEILQRKNNGQNRTVIEAESITINSSGQTGRLITTGFISTENGDYASSIRFADTENAAQPNLYTTNFRLKDATAHIVLKNTMTNAITVRARFLPASGEGAGVVELSAVTIAPNAVKELDLTALINAARTRTDLDSVSVQVISSGSVGSLIGAANFTSNITGIDYDIPLRDSGAPQSSAGAYPVRLDDDYTTNLSITNVGDRAGKFTLQVNFDGGVYAMYPRQLAPGETAAFDFRRMRDEQTPDSSGRVLPRGLTVAQIRWSMVGGAQTRMIARSEIVSASGKVSSSYSCPVCCPNSYNRGFITPDYAVAYFGESRSFAAMQEDRDCYGEIYSPYPVPADWSSSDSSVAEVSYGEVTAVGDGVAYITAAWDAQFAVEDQLARCSLTPMRASETAQMFSRPRITDVTASGATKITQILGNSNIIHFVTPKGATNSQVTLTATLSSNPQQDLSKIDWEGATESTSNPLQATLTKDTALKHVVKIKYDGNTIKELRVWVVWATITSRDIPISSFATTIGRPPGTGFALKGGYDFTHTINPSEIITDNNRPNFSGANTIPPPGGNHPIYGTPLSGGANKKWDNSRQIRFKVFNPSNIALDDTAFAIYGFPSDVLSYPTNDVEGNDDTRTTDEINDPYSQDHRGVLIGQDINQSGLAHRGGVDGDTFEQRNQFREFTRLEIEGTWYRISDFYLWRFHFKFLKSNGVWVDNGSDKALDNLGF